MKLKKMPNVKTAKGFAVLLYPKDENRYILRDSGGQLMIFERKSAAIEAKIRNSEMLKGTRAKIVTVGILL